MAFTTIPGTGATDATQYTGTTGIDALALVNSGAADVRAFQANDGVTWTNFSNVTTGLSIRGGQGNDTLTPGAVATGLLSGSFVNGNKDRDVFGTAALPLDSVANTTLFGGQGNDTILMSQVAGRGLATGSILNGNKNSDTITTNGLAASSVFGGQGIDTLNINGASNGSKVQGDLDGDTITLGAGTLNGTTINGNAGADTITDGGIITASNTSTVFGGAGNDTITINQATVGVILSGDNGNDTVTAGVGTDNLTGGAGTDSLTGATGADVLTGGTGADTFNQLDGVTNSNITATAEGDGGAADGSIDNGDSITVNNADIITDFEIGVDTVRVTGGAAGQVVAAGAAVSNAVNGGVVLVRGDFADGVFTFQATGNDLAQADFSNAGGAAFTITANTAFTVFQGLGAQAALLNANGNFSA